jgi:hypothetical protein
MQKMIWTPSESACANSETPNHAFAPNRINYIKDQDQHWVFHVAFHFLNSYSLYVDAFYSC